MVSGLLKVSGQFYDGTHRKNLAAVDETWQFLPGRSHVWICQFVLYVIYVVVLDKGLDAAIGGWHAT